MAVKTSTRARPTSCENAVRSCIEKFGTLAVLDAMIAEFKWMETVHSIDFHRRMLSSSLSVADSVRNVFFRASDDDEPHLILICVAAKSMVKKLQSVRDEWSSLAVTFETLNSKEMK